ncbi:hypothetical protein KBC04_05300 [Candidatus Babeliales bacterium]|nr:hypothetical protein [Candidatus Babeliales bacterium]MBP9844162.1 hypothetical protein [Candidatus Babeliales bacterium]
MNQQRGYILFITFSILALCVALVSAFMVKGFAHKKLTLLLLEQEQLAQFAISTPALAQSFLAISGKEIEALQAPVEDQQQNQPGENKPEDQPVGGQSLEKIILERMLPVVNKTQTFRLKEIDKGLPAQLNLTFFCESGKININGLYDLENKKFHNEGITGKDQKVFVTWLFDRIAVITEKPSLFGPFVEHLKQRKAPFNDVTQLLEIKEFAACFGQTVFYDEESQKLDPDKKSNKIYLTDIFTVSSEHDTIQPWLLSPSVCALLDIVQTSSKQGESEKKEEKKFDLTSFKLNTDWAKDWEILLKQVYGVSYDKIPEPVRCMFLPQFSVTVFSVLVTVKKQLVESENNMTVGIFAILKQKRLPDNSITYDVIKIYQV